MHVIQLLCFRVFSLPSCSSISLLFITVALGQPDLMREGGIWSEREREKRREGEMDGDIELDREKEAEKYGERDRLRER